jgi:hypothetical protein
VLDGVEDVVVSDPVTAGGGVDLHMAIVYYESVLPEPGRRIRG